METREMTRSCTICGRPALAVRMGPDGKLMSLCMIHAAKANPMPRVMPKGGPDLRSERPKPRQ